MYQSELKSAEKCEEAEEAVRYLSPTLEKYVVADFVIPYRKKSKALFSQKKVCSLSKENHRHD